MEINPTLIEYAPIIIVVVGFIWQNHIFVTPTDLAKMKSDILNQVEEKFATKEIVKEIQSDIQRLETKIDNLIELLIKK